MKSNFGGYLWFPLHVPKYWVLKHKTMQGYTMWCTKEALEKC